METRVFRFPTRLRSSPRATNKRLRERGGKWRPCSPFQNNHWTRTFIGRGLSRPTSNRIQALPAREKTTHPFDSCTHFSCRKPQSSPPRPYFLIYFSPAASTGAKMADALTSSFQTGTSVTSTVTFGAKTYP